MPVRISVQADNSTQFARQPLGNSRITLTEKVRGGHFWPLYTALCGLLLTFLFGFIVWGIGTGNIKGGQAPDLPGTLFLLLICGGFALLCFVVVIRHFVQHGRQQRYSPAVLNLPETLHAGQREKLSFSKPLLRSGQGSNQPGEVRGRLELILMTREAPGKDSDYNKKDAQGMYSIGTQTLWQETLRPVAVAPEAGFAAEWEVIPPNLKQMQVKPNAMYAHLLMTVEMRRGDQEFLKPLRIFLPLE